MTHDTGLPTTAPRWTPADDATLIRLRAEGLTARQVGEVLGRTRRAVLGRGDALRAATPAPAPVVPEPEPVPEPALPDAHGRRTWTPEDDAQIAALRAAGLADAQIAAQVGRTTGAVQVRLSKLRLRGVLDAPSRKRPSPWTPELLAEARAMRAEGLTASQIAIRLGTYPASVGRALRSPETAVGAYEDIVRAATEVERAQAVLAQARARHRQAMEHLLGPVRDAMQDCGLVALPVDDEDDPAWRLAETLRRRGVDLRRVA